MLTLARAATVAELYSSAHYGSNNGLMAFWIALARASGPIEVALSYIAAGRHYEPVFGPIAGVMGVAASGYIVGELFRERWSPQKTSSLVAPVASSLDRV